MARTNSWPYDRSSSIRWRATSSSMRSPRGSKETSTRRRSSRPRVRRTYPWASSRSISSTTLWCLSERRSARVLMVASLPSGRPRIISNSGYCWGSSPAARRGVALTQKMTDAAAKLGQSAIFFGCDFAEHL